MSQPAKPEKITLELSAFPPQTEEDLKANATLQRIDPGALVAKLVAKKLGGIFTVTVVKAA